MFLDAHIHLQDIEEKRLRDSILSLAETQGVKMFFCNAVSPSDWETVRGFAEKDERIKPFFGVHPWNADKVEAGWEKRLEELIAGKLAAIGEIGLDRARLDVDFERQKEIFIRQLDIACSARKPFAVHCVRAWDILIPILRSKDLKGMRFMLHAFSGSQDDMRELVDLGAYFSFRILKNVSEKKRGVFLRVPRQRLLLETDFPYLAVPPENGQGDASEYFVYLRELYSLAAGIMGLDVGELQNIIWENGTVFSH